MTGWLILACYLAGWVAGTRIALTGLMDRSRCAEGYMAENCRKFHRKGCFKPVGEQRPRTVWDAALACLIGVAWPALLVATAVMHTTPPTSGEAKRIAAEQARRIADQQDEIERLQRQIGLRN